MAVYNGANDVGRCIDSLRNQTYRDIEIICVDDGSTDSSLEIMKQYAREDERIRILEQGENKKLLLAIKRGVSEASGDYIMFVDDDDWYETDACERIVQVIESDHPDVVYYGAQLIEPDGSVDDKLRDSRVKLLESCNMKYNGENTLDVEGIQYVYLWNKAVKAEVCKKAYDAIPSVEMTYHSDMYACMMIHYYARSLVSIADKLINYNYSNGISAAMTMSAEKYEFMCKCTRIYEDGIGDFLKKEGALRDLQNFRDGYKKRIMSYICTWRDKVPDEESSKALLHLIDTYGADQVIPLLKHNYYQVNVDRRIYLKRLDHDN